MIKKAQIFRHIFKSVLIAFSIAIIYFIVGNIVLTGGYAELFHFLVAIGLFFGSIVFYFVFIYFRSINKLRWLFGGIAVYLCVLAIANSDVDIYVSNVLKTGKLPSQYVHYQDIDQSVVTFDTKVMTLLVEGDGITTLKPYLTQHNNLIVCNNTISQTTDKQKTQREYLKLDTLGAIIGTYKLSSEDDFFKEGYFINLEKNYYNTWALDGDTLKHPINIHNGSFNLDAKEQEDFIANIEQNATFLFSKEAYEYQDKYKRFDKTVYFENGKWHVFYSDSITYRAIRSKEGKDLFRHYSPEEYEWIPNENANIQFQYYQKIKLQSTNYWTGYLYTNVVIGSDTLKIKEALSMDNKWKNHQVQIKGKEEGNLYRESQYDFIPYLYYANPKLSYQLFTNHLTRLYIIKNK